MERLQRAHRAFEPSQAGFVQKMPDLYIPTWNIRCGNVYTDSWSIPIRFEAHAPSEERPCRTHKSSTILWLAAVATQFPGSSEDVHTGYQLLRKGNGRGPVLHHRLRAVGVQDGGLQHGYLRPAGRLYILLPAKLPRLLFVQPFCTWPHLGCLCTPFACCLCFASGWCKDPNHMAPLVDEATRTRHDHNGHGASQDPM